MRAPRKFAVIGCVPNVQHGDANVLSRSQLPVGDAHREDPAEQGEQPSRYAMVARCDVFFLRPVYMISSPRPIQLCVEGGSFNRGAVKCSPQGNRRVKIQDTLNCVKCVNENLSITHRTRVRRSPRRLTPTLHTKYMLMRGFYDTWRVPHKSTEREYHKINPLFHTV